MSTANRCRKEDRASRLANCAGRDEGADLRSDSSPRQFRLPKILVIEDNDDDARILQALLTQTRGAAIVNRVANGEQAFQYLNGQGEYEERVSPDLVILDLNLPGISGHEVLRWIKYGKHFQDLPVIVVTASTEAADMSRAYRTKANGYLTKPVKAEHLAATIRNLSFYWSC